MTTARIVLYAKDIIIITGKSERTARRIIAAIRKQNDKGKSGLVSVEEFCRYSGLKAEQVKELLRI